MVTAATPASSANESIAALKRNVVTAAAAWLTISEAPFPQLLAMTLRSREGFANRNPPLREAKKANPMSAATV
jgi:hypothetical protein